ncbi:sulfite oxidase heme-binding subunit YedZ [Chloroflexota bacterium]
MKWWQRQYATVLIHVLALLPLAWLIVDLVLGQLTADPIREIQLRTGRYAIILLVISLACSPFYMVLKLKWLLILRRLSGLYGFGYACLHLLNFVEVDYGFNMSLLLQDAIIEKPFAIAGLAALICLIPVAITSTRGWQQRLGHRWRHLHYLVYPATLLAITHFIWQAKIDTRLPVSFAIMVIILLIARLPIVRGFMSQAGEKLRP